VKKPPCIYLIGSLRNPALPQYGQKLRAVGFEVFDDWFAAGSLADDSWRDYEKARGHTYVQALNGHAAKHVFEFDQYHLQRADIAVLVLPAGKSGCIELGWMLGQGKPGYIILDDPERWDVMFMFADEVFLSVEECAIKLRRNHLL
jgi:nucleoside 2-deoxyribosyltransferase